MKEPFNAAKLKPYNPQKSRSFGKGRVNRYDTPNRRKELQVVPKAPTTKPSNVSLNQDLKYDIKKDLTVGKKLVKQLQNISIMAHAGDRLLLGNPVSHSLLTSNPSMKTVTRVLEEATESFSQTPSNERLNAREGKKTQAQGMMTVTVENSTESSQDEAIK